MKWHVRGIVLALFASLVGLTLIVRTSTPAEASTAIRIAFFSSLFVGLWSGVTLVLYGFRRNVERSFIWGFLTAFSVMAFILLQKLL